MGFVGVCVDVIVECINMMKWMFYYYFDSKEGLYEVVLEKVYGDICVFEQELYVGDMELCEGMCCFVEFMFDYYDKYCDFVCFVLIENIYGVKYFEQFKLFKNCNVSIIKMFEELVECGVVSGVFCKDIDVFDLYLLISLFCFYCVLNCYMFGVVFGCDLLVLCLCVWYCDMIVDVVFCYVVV